MKSSRSVPTQHHREHVKETQKSTKILEDLEGELDVDLEGELDVDLEGELDVDLAATSH